MGIKKVLKGLFRSTTPLDVATPPPTNDDNLKSHLQAEEGEFTRKNDVVKEGIWKETPISSSNLSEHQKPKWVYKEAYKGFMILTNDPDAVADWKELIDKGQTMGLYTEAYWKKYFDKDIKQDPNDDQLSHDDVEFVRKKAQELGQEKAIEAMMKEKETTYVMPTKDIKNQ